MPRLEPTSSARPACCLSCNGFGRVPSHGSSAVSPATLARGGHIVNGSLERVTDATPSVHNGGDPDMLFLQSI